MASILLERCKLLTSSIRMLERMHRFPSQLDVSQRRSLDYADLVHDLLPGLAAPKQNKPATFKSKGAEAKVAEVPLGLQLMSLFALHDPQAREREMIDPSQAREGVAALMRLRRQLLLWTICVTSAAEDMTRSLGWDPMSPSFGRTGDCVPDHARVMKPSVAKLIYTSGRAWQGLGQHDAAMLAFQRMMILYPLWGAPLLDMAKSELCIGRFSAALKYLLEYCGKEFGDRLPDPPLVTDVLTIDKEIGLLLLLIEGSLRELAKVSAAFGHDELAFEMKPAGEVYLGRSLSHDKNVTKALEVQYEASLLEEKRAKEDSLAYRASQMKSKALKLLDQSKALLA